MKQKENSNRANDQVRLSNNDTIKVDAEIYVRKIIKKYKTNTTENKV
ncbi:MAG: hypothetical protein KC646_04425 [Candidatus Cloacimonetes bacterium]|nr:hypothetical protein [Candidatus Cloacimonadota bacterium]